MPSHTVQSALVQMFHDSQAPWGFPRWKEITGVSHGIFPKDNDPLPKGFSRNDLTSIWTYFDQFRAKVGEEAKITFASGTSNSARSPGRAIWRRWVTERWREWRIHSRIIEVLNAESLHPLTLALGSQDESGHSSTDLVWPNGTLYVPLAVDGVVSALFGVEALNQRGQIPMKLRAMVQALIQRTWKVIHNQVNRSRARIGKLEDEAMQAFENVDKEKPAKSEIKLAIIKVARWKALAEFLQSKHNLETMADMEGTLAQLMIELGANVEPSSAKPKKKLCKVTPQALSSLAKQEDVADVLAMYQDFFSSPSAQDSVDLNQQHSTVPFQFGDLENDSDPGVEMESTLSFDTLASNLGFKDGRPLLFSRYRHRGGFTSWDTDKAHLFEDANAQNNPDMVPITLHWHQLAGVHGLTRMVFHPEPEAGRCCGALVADEVGLGKTYQAATMIAFLTDIVMRQKINAKMPPIIEQNPYAQDEKALPDLPHLVVVPGTLVSQWEVELKSIIQGGTFSILLYGTGKGPRDDFWGPEGPFRTSTLSGASMIILTSQSTVQQDFSLLYAWSKPKGDLPWAHPPRLATYDAVVSNTLFGQRFLSIAFDEAQGYRNTGVRHSSALLIRELSLFSFALSGTPLQTSTKDVAAIGRLIGIPYFLSQAAFDEEKSDASTLRRAKSDAEDTAGAVESELTLCQMAIAHRMQQQFGGRVLRRTVDSKDWEGNVLISLPPYKELRVVVKLTDREMGFISQISNDVKDSISVSNGLLMIASHSFYIEHRMCVGYARLGLQDAIPHFESLEEWETKKSTKIDTCCRLCAHILSRDDAPEPYVENGTVVYPPIPRALLNKMLIQLIKIVIHQEFPSLGPLLRNILDLYGIKHLYMDGQTPFQKRAKIVRQFCESTEYRVLIISSVGATGLNLSAASVMILLDQPWSAQDERQIRGRVHRQPQSKVVRCYHILADETADIVLSSMASGKKTMMDAFLEKDAGKEMYELLSGRSLVAAEDENDEDDPEVKEANRARVQKEKAEAKGKRKADHGRKPKKKKQKKTGKGADGEEPTKQAPELMDIDDEPRASSSRTGLDRSLPPLGTGLTTEDDTSDGDALTAGTTTDGLLTEYDADKSMASSPSQTRAPSPSPRTGEPEPETDDHRMAVSPVPHSLSRAPSADFPGHPNPTTAPQEAGTRRRRGELSDSSASPEGSKRRCLVPYPSSPASQPSDEEQQLLGERGRSPGPENQNQQDEGPSNQSEASRQAPAVFTPPQPSPAPPLPPTQPSPSPAPPTPPRQPSPSPLPRSNAAANFLPVRRQSQFRMPVEHRPSRALSSQPPSQQPRAPAMMKPGRHDRERTQPPPGGSSSIRDRFNAIMGDKSVDGNPLEDNEPRPGPGLLNTGKTPSTSAPPNTQLESASSSTKPKKRTNPFARYPQAGSMSERPSSSSSHPDIPDFRRPMPFTTRREGHGTLSPPAANAQSKNPYKHGRSRK